MAAVLVSILLSLLLVGAAVWMLYRVQNRKSAPSASSSEYSGSQGEPVVLDPPIEDVEVPDPAIRVAVGLEGIESNYSKIFGVPQFLLNETQWWAAGEAVPLETAEGAGRVILNNPTFEKKELLREPQQSFQPPQSFFEDDVLERLRRAGMQSVSGSIMNDVQPPGCNQVTNQPWDKVLGCPEQPVYRIMPTVTHNSTLINDGPSVPGNSQTSKASIRPVMLNSAIGEFRNDVYETRDDGGDDGGGTRPVMLNKITGEIEGEGRTRFIRNDQAAFSVGSSDIKAIQLLINDRGYMSERAGSVFANTNPMGRFEEMLGQIADAIGDQASDRMPVGQAPPRDSIRSAIEGLKQAAEILRESLPELPQPALKALYDDMKETCERLGDHENTANPGAVVQALRGIQEAIRDSSVDLGELGLLGGPAEGPARSSIMGVKDGPFVDRDFEGPLGGAIADIITGAQMTTESGRQRFDNSRFSKRTSTAASDTNMAIKADPSKFSREEFMYELSFDPPPSTAQLPGVLRSQRTRREVSAY